MGGTGAQRSIWGLARRQHWVVTSAQLIAAGYTRHAIRHRVATGRLHRVHRGVYAVGRRGLTQEGEWMAAVLACGPAALLSHESAGALWGIRRVPSTIDVSVPAQRAPRVKGVKVHRRAELADGRRIKGIPVTSPVRTLTDLAQHLSGAHLERAISEADRLGVVDPTQLRAELEGERRHGAKRLRDLLDSHTFALTDSELERLFLPIALRAGLPKPETQRLVSGYRVDFYWPELGLVVETDGLRYHRTPGQQKKDRLRDQTLTAAGLRVLRFTHEQVKFESAHVADILRRL